MQLSLHTDYALRTLMALAAGDRLLSVDRIAQGYGISANHLAKVAQRLQAEGFVETVRGRGGGMRLALAPEQIIVGTVVRRFERLDGLVECFGAGSGCRIDGVCGLKGALGQALEAFLATLDKVTLADITRQRVPIWDRLEPVVAA